MSIRRGAIVIECDSPRCYAEQMFDADSLEGSSLSECITDAGWEDRCGTHVCPQCIAEETPEPSESRERGDDDGIEYADPRDYRDERE